MTGREIRPRIVARLLRLRFVRESLEGPIDLAVLREKPTPRAWAGLGLIAWSYVMGWPAVGLLAWLAFRWEKPLLLVIGGPLVYGLSHVVFTAGAWLAGSRYVRPLLRWAARRVVERLGGAPLPPDHAGDADSGTQ